jgi:hypothetical protein
MYVYTVYICIYTIYIICIYYYIYNAYTQLIQEREAERLARLDAKKLRKAAEREAARLLQEQGTAATAASGLATRTGGPIERENVSFRHSSKNLPLRGVTDESGGSIEGGRGGGGKQGGGVSSELAMAMARRRNANAANF